MRCEEDLLEIEIGVKAEDNGSFTWNHFVKINSHDDQIVNILDDAPDFIKEILLKEEIDDPLDEGNALQITIYVGNYYGPLTYVVFIYGGMCENDKRKLIDSSLLEEAMEVAIKDCFKEMDEERKLNSVKLQCG
jgi:hypothetical protein